MVAGFKVTGAAVVLPTKDGKEQYLYRSGAVLPVEGFTEAGIERAVGLRLIERVEIADAEPATPAESEPPEPYKGVTVADLKAEIEERNKDRADDVKIVPAEPGNRPELVAALVADDAKQS